MDVSVNPSGIVYSVESNGKIQSFNGSGVFQSSIDGKSSAPGGLNSTSDIIVDYSHHIYVADINNLNVQKFDTQGNLLLSIGSGTQFSYPEALALDAQENIYLADAGTHQYILKINSTSGQVMSTIGAGSFLNLYDLTVLSNGHIYALDCTYASVVVFDANGNYLNCWGEARMTRPIAIESDSTGNIYVLDQGTEQALKFSGNGTLLLMFSLPNAFDFTYDKTSDTLLVCDNNQVCFRYSTSGVLLFNLAPSARILYLDGSQCTFYGLETSAVFVYNKSAPAVSTLIATQLHTANPSLPFIYPTSLPNPNCVYEVDDCAYCSPNPITVNTSLVSVSCLFTNNIWAWNFQSRSQDYVIASYGNVTISGSNNIVLGDFIQAPTAVISFIFDPVNNRSSQINVTGCVTLNGMIDIIFTSQPPQGTSKYLIFPSNCSTSQIFPQIRAYASYPNVNCDL